MFGKNDLAFAQVRKPSFYVTQPMRQATIQPLRAFGLVDSSGERFNGFTCSSVGDEFIEAVSHGYQPYRQNVVDHLVRWVRGEHDKVKSSAALTDALSPIEATTARGREFLRERVIGGSTVDSLRRRNALAWVETLPVDTKTEVVWETKPDMIDEDHWRDLHVGAMFFLVRDAAIRLLDKIEAEIGNQSELCLSLTEPIPHVIAEFCSELRTLADEFTRKGCDPTPGLAAAAFCRECSDSSDVRVIERLLAREGRVLKQRGNDVVPGVAFRGAAIGEADTARSDEEVGDETQSGKTIPLPRGISNRVRNLYWLNFDLRGELDDKLFTSTQQGGESS